MEDDGIMNHVKLLLERKAKKGQGAFDEIIQVLKGKSRVHSPGLSLASANAILHTKTPTSNG